jgi:hypothetical protein
MDLARTGHQALSLAFSAAMLAFPVTAHAAFEELLALWNRMRGDPYVLDTIPRSIADQTLDCMPEALVSYAGTHLRYARGVRVHPAFIERLKRFEQLVIDVSKDIYERPAKRLIHQGAYNCRSVRGNQTRISEHALGNAIDVRGFEFNAMARQQARNSQLPKSLRRKFVVSVHDHWNSAKESDRLHREFLKELSRRLQEQDAMFRGVIGPAHPRHGGHLHLDCGPFSYISGLK